MRRISVRKSEERGAISILVALLMVVLLGFAALAIDVGLMYAEKAELQNGADAAALSVAQACAEGPGDPGCTASTTLADTMADLNALDGMTNIQSVVIPPGSQQVTVTTGAEEVGADENSVSLHFAKIFGITSAEIGAHATAEWGTPIAGIAPFPLAFSICQVIEETDDLQLFVSHGDDADASCEYGPAGHVVPGGFGWLPQQTGLCSAEVDVDLEYAASDPGNDGPQNCDELMASWKADIASGEPPIELLPIFDDVDTTPNPDEFSLIGFAAVEIHGWYFSGDAFHNTSSDVGADLACTGSCRGIIGKFVDMVSLEDGYELGPVVEDLDTTIVRLTLGDDE